MITMRRKKERRRVQAVNRNVWIGFPPPEGEEGHSGGLGVLAEFYEIELGPGGIFAHDTREDLEIFNYVYEGAVAQEGSTGNSGVVHAGEFQRMTIGRGVRQKEMNASKGGRTRLFQIVLYSAKAGLDSSHEQRRFAAAQRHNVLCPVAAPDGRKGSLRILQDAIVYSSVLDPGYHIAHELLPGRCAWLQIIRGEVTLHDSQLMEGDAAGLTAESAVSLTAQGNTELLLVDAGPAAGYPVGWIVP